MPLAWNTKACRLGWTCYIPLPNIFERQTIIFGFFCKKHFLYAVVVFVPFSLICFKK
jgi:hypothetical protein